MTTITPPHHKTLHHYNTLGHAHELTFSCYRCSDYLSDPVACEIFLAVLSETRDLYQFRIWAYVLMPTHVHLIIWPLVAEYDIAKIDSGLKGVMAKRYRKYLEVADPEKCKLFMVNSRGKETFRFWQPGGGFDHNLWNAAPIHHAIQYIEANPVRKQISANPEEYRWSSAYARAKNEGVVPDRFEVPVEMSNPQYQRIGAV
jgi:putative transposase